MDTFGSRLKSVRKELGFKSQGELGKAIGVSHVTISAWERDEYRPDGDNLYALLEVIKVRKKWLSDGKGDKSILLLTRENISEQNAEYLGHIDSWDSNTPLDNDEAEIPFFMEVELAAGIGSDLMQENQGAKLRFSKSTLGRCGVDPSNAACVKVMGNSMEPRLFDGDVVGVDLGNKRIVDDKVYAINHDGLLRIKKLNLLPRGGLRVSSYNSDEHEDEIICSEDRGTVNIIGRVFWSSSIWY